VPCRLDKTARQTESKGCGLEFRAPGLDVITAEKSIKECKSDGDDELGRKGAIILVHLGTGDVSGSAEARYYGCWGCGAFAAGAIAGPRSQLPMHLRFTTHRAPSTWRLRSPGLRGAGAGRLSDLPGPAALSLLLPLRQRLTPLPA